MMAARLATIRFGGVALRRLPLVPWLMSVSTLCLSLAKLVRLLGRPVADAGVPVG
jgi:hypothetical protein